MLPGSGAAVRFTSLTRSGVAPPHPDRVIGTRTLIRAVLIPDRPPPVLSPRSGYTVDSALQLNHRTAAIQVPGTRALFVQIDHVVQSEHERGPDRPGRRIRRPGAACVPARSRISALLHAVADGEFVYLTRRGKRVAALSPPTSPRTTRRLSTSTGPSARMKPGHGCLRGRGHPLRPVDRRGARVRPGHTASRSPAAPPGGTSLDKPLRPKILAHPLPVRDPPPAPCRTASGRSHTYTTSSFTIHTLPLYPIISHPHSRASEPSSGRQTASASGCLAAALRRARGPVFGSRFP